MPREFSTKKSFIFQVIASILALACSLSKGSHLHPLRHAVEDLNVRRQNNRDVLRWLPMEASAYLVWHFKLLLAGQGIVCSMSGAG